MSVVADVPTGELLIYSVTTDSRRARNQKIAGNIHTGFAHSIGQIMAPRSYREEKKIYWDRNKDEITDTRPGIFIKH